MTSSISIRSASPADASIIDEIYNHYVLHSTCTYQESPDPPQVRVAWLTDRHPNHPVIVAVQNGQVIAWGSLVPFHPRSAYGRTVEDALYVHHSHLGQGIGKLVLNELIQRAIQLGHHTMVARVSAEQTASIALHQKLGFTQAGHLREAGWKFGRWLDALFLQRML